MRSFFGLSSEYIQAVYEQFFYMKYSGGWSFTEAYNLPIGLRNWFFNRLVKQLKDESEKLKNSSNSKQGSQQLTKHNQPRPPPNLK